MLVSVIYILLVMVSKILALKEYSPNVGSVLFSSKEIKKKHHWSKEDISLLRARRYFQSLLPPKEFLNSLNNEDYVDRLLEYCKNAYSNVKREAKDLESDVIMTKALSDSLGGFLKVYVLPAAKLHYYAGTISSDHITKLFDIYEEIKKYLGTDGKGWKCPDANLLKSVSIGVHTTPPSKPINDSCNSFAYFEKTKDGFSIALPQVHWDNKSSTMYFPLKNVSSVPLNTVDRLKTLSKYYDAAKNCLREKNPNELKSFDTKFQTWLSKDIVPHLTDNNLYLALGKVLSLLNSTFYINNMELSTLQEQHKPYCYCLSNKIMIVIILLIIEAIWCVLAIIVFVVKKNKKKKKNKSSNMFMFVQRSEPDNKGEHESFFGRLKQTRNVEVHPRPPSYKVLKDTHTQRPTTPPFDRATIISMRSLCGDPSADETRPLYSVSQKTITAGTGSEIYFNRKSQSIEAIIADSRRKSKKLAISKYPYDENPISVNSNIITIIDETSPPAHRLDTKPTKKDNSRKKSDLKKSNKADKIKQNEDTVSKNVSLRRNHRECDKRHEKSKRRVRGQLELKMVKKTPEIIMSEIKTESANSEPTSHECFCTPNIQSESDITHIEKVIREVNAVDPAKMCPCTDCLAFMCPKQGEDVSESAGQVSRSTEVNNPAITDPFCGDKQSKTVQLATHIERPLNTTDFKDDASNKSHFGLVFEKAQTEISIDVSAPGLKKHQRKSRIPKLYMASLKLPSAVKERPEIRLDDTRKEKRRSMIPQPKKKSVDDNVITESGILKIQTKLNNTL